MDGEAMFNWRFVFDLEYLEAERMIVIKSKVSTRSQGHRKVMGSPEGHEVIPENFGVQSAEAKVPKHVGNCVRC